MSVTPVTSLSTYAKAIGKAYVYVASDPTSAVSWQLLGITEGDIAVEEKHQFNDYTLKEWTGDAVHQRNVDGSSIHINVPLIWGDETLYDTLSPTGAKGGGRPAPIAVVTKTVLVIPITEVGTGLTFDGTTWTAAAPKHAIWLHKASFEPGTYAFKHAEGGKVIRTIGIMPLFDDTKPSGQMLYTIGDPAAQGITTYRL
jgi:hypothetical protein